MADWEGLAPPHRRTVRFAIFEFDLTGLKLRRNGLEIRLQRQPAMLLARLLNRAGELVTREELRQVIWPSGTYVEFNFGLNTAVNRLRRALRDSASEPRYIETVPKEGYRFIAPIELVLPQPESGPEPVEKNPGPDSAIDPEIPSTAAVVHGPGHRKEAVILGAVLVGVCGVVLTVWAGRRATPGGTATPVHSMIPLPAGQVPEAVAISLAGDLIVYQVARGGAHRLYRRYLNEEESRPVPGAEEGTQPFFSPDGKQVGFFAPASIRVSGPDGVRDLVGIPATFALRMAIWAEDQFVYYTTPAEGIWRVNARGGKPEAILKPASGGKDPPLYFPQEVLAGNPLIGNPPALLFSVNNGPIRRWIAWSGLGGDPSPHVLLNRAMGGQMACGYLFSWWQGKLRAARFDVANRRLSGSPVDALSNVANNGWRGPIASVANNGTLVYVEDYQTRKLLLWVDGNGKQTALPPPPAVYEQAEVSPDGTRLCIVRRDGPSLWSVWIYDQRTGAWTSLLNIEAPKPRVLWSPDGKEILAAAAMGDDQFVNLYRIVPGGQAAPERLTQEPDYGQFPGSWSAARNAVLFTEGVHPGTQSDIHVLPLDGERRPRAMVATSGVERCPAFSPDGQWFVYSSDHGGSEQVFMQKYDQSAPPRQISTAGGVCPAWSSDGKKLYYLDSSRALLEVPYAGNGITGPERQLFPAGFTEGTDWWTRGYSVARDGRFLVIRAAPGERPPPSQIHMIMNWTTELKQLAP